MAFGEGRGGDGAGAGGSCAGAAFERMTAAASGGGTEFPMRAILLVSVPVRT